ncbi:conserved Plasmodium protein, unknown function [Plasmodium vivax]|uniref:Uncharacterized protein n=6 Tax=Plasmodium vivax TaxID=5855 RepID=A5K0D3_PLAVS|nr:hypothetical protein, conserved [Plasmodium vivax]KMZ78380.1 hypothetical protein PVIIG_01158 [Plasmodium vivax India VII]KMZ83567.1 hypothetical protein PVBG_00647 [Plasmodium vivax Brazil I]KMZ91014.1 hypothetical protein PVMG_05844 [Plasmodium vivax Mauritania I]KMZ97692.1 hypothetical protein PVNG_06018 [Plasmodium vivax North Korean]EDL46780.1 hypothetical protein, conserved [Plasmodium vivax]|eukprot:XP_001616507.1 hypothetical protein [Plasmodium vivax Sal-1]
MGTPQMSKQASPMQMNNVEFVGDKGVEELLSKISANYEECTKYDAYMAQDDAEEEEDEEAGEKGHASMGGSFQNVKAGRGTKMANAEKLGKSERANSNSRANGETHKGSNNAVMDNLRDFIFKKKMTNDRQSGKAASFGKPGRNVFTNLNVRKKRIMESSEESDENCHSVKKIIDYVKKKKKQRKG